jgi:hypothetical protein
MNQDFEELLNNKLFWVIAFIGFSLMAFVGVRTYLVEKVTDNVIEKLQKEYTPGPYSPGFDPDLVDPNFFKNR